MPYLSHLIGIWWIQPSLSLYSSSSRLLSFVIFRDNFTFYLYGNEKCKHFLNWMNLL